MTTILLVIHILVCLSLIGIVLIQGGKGAELGSAFGGGSSQTLFGGRGAATFLGKMTTVVAIVFMVTSLLLAIISVKGGSITSTSVMDQGTATETKTTTTAPASQNTAEKAGVKPKQSEKPADKPAK
jgi:preprotein translocase subunit SecG